MLSKACYVATYRRKLEELAGLPDVELTLIVPPYWRFDGGKSPLEPGFSEGYRMIVENPMLNGNHHLHFYPNLHNHLQRLKPDLLHIDEEPYDFVTFHALRTARNLGIKTVFFTWQNIRRTFPLPFSIFENHILKNADAAIAGSTGAAEVLRDKGFCRPLYVIPQFGVDPEVYHRPPVADGSAGRKAFHIGYIGRLVEEKGLLVLLQAVAGLIGNWKLSILGDGSFRPQIEQKIQSLGIAECVEIQKSIPSTSIPEHLSQLDVLVLPSLTTAPWKEQFGRVLIEAMACEVPVIGSDSGAIPEVIGEAGLIFPEGDAGELQKQLQQLMVNENFRQELAARGRERVLNYYTQQKVAEQTYNVYRQILTYSKESVNNLPKAKEMA